MTETVHFGEHITIDGYGGNEALLDSQENVLKTINGLVTLLGMKLLAQPNVYHADSNNKKDPGGWTGVAVIMESHISIHTFPKRGFLSADVYTCKNGLNAEVITSYFIDSFGLKDIEKNFLIRGNKYPNSNIY